MLKSVIQSFEVERIINNTFGFLISFGETQKERKNLQIEDKNIPTFLKQKGKKRSYSGTGNKAIKIKK